MRMLTPPNRQRGAVLFVSLMILVLLTLLGLASMQVTTLQERMSGNYRTLNLAFQNSESRIRVQEAAIKQTTDNGVVYYNANPAEFDDNCINSDPDAWAQTVATRTQFTKRVDKCFNWSSRKWGSKVNEETGNIYQVQAADFDRAVDESSIVVLETYYIP